MKRFATAAVSALVLAGACQTTDPYTRETKVSNTAKGAAIGAAAGAVLGAVTNTSSGRQAAKNAMIGAGVGALGGAAVGGYMDEQERQLRERLDKTGVGVTRSGENLILNMPSDVTFAFDKADINPDFWPVLRDVAFVLEKYDKTIVNIDGHTDTSGSAEYNQKLSVARAENVAHHLLQEGVMPERFIVTGYGESRPRIVTGDGVKEPLNRRVEIRISPLTN